MKENSIRVWKEYIAQKAASVTGLLNRTVRSSGRVLRTWISGDFSLGEAVPPKAGSDRRRSEGTYIYRLNPWTWSEDAEYYQYMLERNAKPYEAIYIPEPPRPTDFSSLTEADLARLLAIADERQDLELALRVGEIAASRPDPEPSPPPDLGLSSRVTFNKKGRSPKRTRGLTTYGRRMLRSGVVLMEQKYGKRNLAMVTLTVPNLPYPELEKVNREMGKIMNRFLVNYRRMVPEPAFAYCVEVQEKRAERTGFPVLHVHLIIPSRKDASSPFYLSKEQIRDLWERALAPTLGRKVECKSATRVETIRKSAANYLSKYLSKGGKTLRKIINKGFGNLLPRQWWGMDRELKREVKASILEFRDSTADVFSNNLMMLQELGVLSYRPVTVTRPIRSNDGEPQIDEATGEPICTKLTVGFYGFFRVPNYKDFLVPSVELLSKVIQNFLPPPPLGLTPEPPWGET